MITWDENKRLRNLRCHAVDFADIDEFFSGDLLTLQDEREDYGEVRYQSIGLISGVPL